MFWNPANILLAWSSNQRDAPESKGWNCTKGLCIVSLFHNLDSLNCPSVKQLAESQTETQKICNAGLTRINGLQLDTLEDAMSTWPQRVKPDSSKSKNFVELTPQGQKPVFVSNSTTSSSTLKSESF